MKIVNETTYKGIKLEHIGNYLYANGIEWAFIGDTPRTEKDLINIFKKYI